MRRESKTACGAGVVVLALAAGARAQPVVAVFDEIRQGQATLGVPGTQTSLLTAAIEAAFPGVVFRHMNLLTEKDLVGADVVFLMATRANSEAIAPLSPAEQTALTAFVASGGAAIIACDNDSFGGAGSDPANESLADPFGVDVSGTGAAWQQSATVIDPSLSPVTSGPFGEVPSFSVGWSGWFDAYPKIAILLATLDANGHASLLEFPPGGMGSGRVVLLSDSTLLGDMWLNDRAITLVRNALAAVRPACAADVNHDGQLNSQDFLDFLTCFFDPTCPGADFNADGQANSQDFFDFLAAFFAGC
jgi:hypothetical protein